MQIPKTLGPADIEMNEVLGALMTRFKVIYFCMGCLALLVPVPSILQGANPVPALMPGVVAALILIVFYFILRLRVRRRIEAVEGAFEQVSWTLMPDHLVIESVRSRAEFPWGEQRKCEVKGSVISLLNGGGLRYVFPVRACASPAEAAEVAAWIQSKIREARG